ncbi:MAG: ATP synthase F1 subunit epsilon [Candidatus Moranbacteria bacterium RIFCSPHIGHO2_02_FULL_40_12b]|nr:MAG: ATP synthase F1 subunit epsilon [Candidatus Moranbacteria bacterium RIFCSPHIGHO2_02_FULL_40_12b]OGI23698.1 MAG: ATP synthase F1 subunit epsilon [Candidatus Moranbacteria bacterium RIFCSPHIGHO2_12_FULL_40_10]
MSLRIKFKVVTPEKTVYEDEIDQATLPVTDGEVTILPNHRSYVATLKAGEIILKKEGKEISLSAAGGFLEFDKNNLVILADRAERAEEIDLKRAKEARIRAEELKKEKISTDDEDYARVAAMIEKEAARIKVAKKHRTRRGMRID